MENKNNFYLYGASIQGIQEFIFKTNKLKEIVGASEIIEDICTDFFNKECTNFNPDNLIIGAAGNIKYIFDIKEDCEALVLEFPMKVMNKAPGITISQAVVAFEDNLAEALRALDEKLKEQRNKIPMPLEMGCHALERARATDGVAFEEDNDDLIDRASSNKRKSAVNGSLKLFEDFIGFQIEREKQPLDVSNIVKGHKNNWIAIIHADGNGIGNLVIDLSEKLQNLDLHLQKSTFHNFSKALDKGTKQATQEAIKAVLVKREIEIRRKIGHEDKALEHYPFRPIILGGDDITMIIRGDLALDFTRLFMEKFEVYVNDYVKDVLKGIDIKCDITICAGIAYVKDSYPFHYAVDLAEKLCKEAKTYSKSFQGSIPSSLSFFKVQDSFIENKLEIIRKRTGLIEESGIDYNFGPYLLKDDSGNKGIYELINKLDILRKKTEDKNDKTRAVSKLRQLVSKSFKNQATFEFMKDRMKEVNEKFYNDLRMDQFINNENKSIFYELIQIHTIHE